MAGDVQTERRVADTPHRAWTPQEERALLERLLGGDGEPSAAGVGEPPVHLKAVRLSWRKPCAVLALLVVAVASGAFFKVAANDELFWAARRGSVAAAWLALLRGADPAHVQPDGDTALQAAARSGRKGAVSLLLARGAPADRGAALHGAVARGFAEIATALLDAGADVNLPGIHGDPPFRYAVYFGRWRKGGAETIQLLLDRGTRLDAFTAAALGDVKALREALASAPWTSTAVSFHRTTALHWAAQAGNVDAVRCLLDAGADIDAGPPYIRTPLQEAIIGDHPDVVQLLLERGADPNARPSSQHARDGGRSSLSLARQFGDEETIGLLRDYGATD